MGSHREPYIGIELPVEARLGVVLFPIDYLCCRPGCRSSGYTDVFTAMVLNMLGLCRLLQCDVLISSEMSCEVACGIVKLEAPSATATVNKVAVYQSACGSGPDVWLRKSGAVTLADDPNRCFSES